MPKTGFEQLPNKGKLFYWTLKYGRVIIISFQAIIISLLFYKLHLYNSLTDISESIEEKVAIVQSQNGTERAIKDVQLRARALREAMENSFSPVSYTELVGRAAPEEITITTLILENNSIRFSAISRNLYAFGQLVDNLSKEESVTDVSLIGAQLNKDTNQFTFNIELALEKL